MGSVSVNPPKTPVTKGSNGIATATIPNVCKMPGPPAPFVPVPLPNIGKSGKNPQGYTQDVTVEGNAVAIKGSTFESMGDVASKGTGGGLISANCEGITKFVGPGSMDVKFEGGNVQFLSDPMLNNCGPGGSPPNSATMVGVLQTSGLAAVYGDEPCPICGETHDEKVRLEESVDTKGACGDLIKAANAAVKDAAAERQRRLDALKAQAKTAREEEIAAEELRISTASEKVPAAVVASWKERLAKRKAEPIPEPQLPPAAISAMAGVVKCKTCGHIHAGFSMSQYSDVQAKMPGGWHSPTASRNILGDGPTKPTPGIAKFIVHVGANRARFLNRWQYCQQQREDYNSGLIDELHIPPGQCAGQQMLLHTLDHGCRPIGLTERWYKSESPGVRYEGDVFVRDMGKDGRPGPRRPARKNPGEFGGDDAVPPCGTCQVILAALLCPKHRAAECVYKKLPEEACHKC